jgi:predicted nucleotidyltransferase
MHEAIAQHAHAISGICQRFHIKRLEVFGSAARAADFNPSQSDVDFLVEFASGPERGFRNFLAAKAALESELGRKVDLIEDGSIKNPFVLAAINAGKEPLYAA